MANNTINDNAALVSANMSALSSLIAQLDSANNAILAFGQQISNSSGDISMSFEQISISATNAAKVMQGMTGVSKSHSASILDTANSYSSLIANSITIASAIAEVTKGIRASISTATLYHSSMLGLTAATTAARVAAIALAATLSMGLSLAINAVITGISFLISKQEDQKNTQKELAEEQEAAKKIQEDARQEQEAYANTTIKSKSEMILLIAELKNFKGSKEEESKKVAELNRKYGETLGHYSSIARWYDTLVAKSEDYCQAMVLETQMQIAAKKAADGEMKMLNNPKRENESYSLAYMEGRKEADNAYEQLNILSEKYGAIKSHMFSGGEAIKVNKITSNNTPQQENILPPKEEVPLLDIAQMNTYEDIEKALAHYNKNLRSARETERTEIAKSIRELENLRKAWEDATAPEQQISIPAPIEQLNTQKDLNEALSYYQELQQTQTGKDFLDTQSNIDGIQKKQGSLQSLASLPSIQKESVELEKIKDDNKKLLMELKVIGIDELKGRLEDINSILGNQESGLNEEETQKLNELKTQYEEYFETLSNSRNITEDLANGLGAIGNAMGNLSGMVGEGAGQWLEWGANVINSVGVAITQMAALLPAKNADAVANTQVAGTGAAAAVSSIPIVGPIMAVAAIASVIAAIASIPKFASGGIAYGPTLGLFGEYAGASNNPEVVAPLDRLRSLIQPVDNGMGGQVEFKIQGRELVGILHKINHINSRIHG